MCTSRPDAVADTSMPGTKPNPSTSAAAAARASPATVSWSVTASTVTPAARARASNVSGECSPSLAVVWLCKSIKSTMEALEPWPKPREASPPFPWEGTRFLGTGSIQPHLRGRTQKRYTSRC